MTIYPQNNNEMITMVNNNNKNNIDNNNNLLPTYRALISIPAVALVLTLAVPRQLVKVGRLLLTEEAQVAVGRNAVPFEGKTFRSSEGDGQVGDVVTRDCERRRGVGGEGKKRTRRGRRMKEEAQEGLMSSHEKHFTLTS